jgi:hypothetical protein
MQGSSLAKYGRSKEKRSDCKQVVLAAVVNTEGIMVTEIYEALNINKIPCKRRKFVWHPKRPPEFMPNGNQVVSSG